MIVLLELYATPLKAYLFKFLTVFNPIVGKSTLKSCFLSFLLKLLDLFLLKMDMIV